MRTWKVARAGQRRNVAALRCSLVRWCRGATVAHACYHDPAVAARAFGCESEAVVALQAAPHVAPRRVLPHNWRLVVVLRPLEIQRFKVEVGAGFGILQQPHAFARAVAVHALASQPQVQARRHPGRVVTGLQRGAGPRHLHGWLSALAVRAIGRRRRRRWCCEIRIEIHFAAHVDCRSWVQQQQRQ